jgi:hypothetical protein
VITSKQILLLSERYADTFNVNSKIVELIVNPQSSSELKSLFTDRFRFIARKSTKLVYFWNANFAVHYEIKHRLQLDDEVTFDGQVKFSGQGIPSMIQSDMIEFFVSHISTNVNYIKPFKEIFNSDWRWLDSYISGASNYIEMWHKKFNQKIGEK